jgi:hypothetical protein
MIKLKAHITGIAPETLIKLDGVRGLFYHGCQSPS